MQYNNISIKKPRSITIVMLEVLAALLPAIICMIYFYGINYLFYILNSSLCAILSEGLILYTRGQNLTNIIYRIKDLSAVVTAILLSLCMPPDIPWYLLSLGTIFAIILAKQLYGGLGQNIFNPAMVGYCILLISFPAIFTNWPVTENIKNFNYNFIENNINYNIYDSISSATPLETIKSQTKNDQTIYNIQKNNQTIFSAWSLINLCYLIGGIYLILRKIITFIPSLTFLITLSGLALLLSNINSDIYPDIIITLFSGSTMIAAFFIITDPVTMPANTKSKIIYVFGIAFFTYIIRTFAGYPDGVAFSVLLMNATVPLLDKINIPKPFGVS